MTAAWVDRAERRFRFLELPNLAAFMAAMNAFCAILASIKPEFPEQLLLEPNHIVHGQVWRALTFVLVPPDMPFIWLIFWLLLYYVYLKALEQAWGDFKLTLYVLIGALATAAASVITRVPFDSFFFVMSLFLAFANINPETQLLLFFVIPVKMKWIAWAAWFIVVWNLLFYGFQARVAIAAGLLNYALYFGPDHYLQVRQAWRRRRFRA